MAKAPREHLAEQPGDERRRNWVEVRTVFTEEQAVAEAKRCLDCGLCSECMQCVKACSAGAVLHDQQAEIVEIDAGSLILTPGFEEFQATLRGEFGMGRYANVLTSVQFERMLSAAGPTGGHVQRPSDGGEVKRIAFVQCVGSRDAAKGNGYCSSICCMSATKEAMVALEHAHGHDLDVIHLLHGRARLRQGVRQLRRPRPRRARSQVHPRHPLPRGRDARQQRPADPLLR